MLKLVRLGRKLSKERAAAQLGIVAGWYAKLEHGRLLPTPALAKRLRQWAIDGVSFEGAPPPREKPQDAVVTPGWRKVRLGIPPEDLKALRGAADRLGMSQESIILLALRRFLANKLAFATLGEAVKEVEHARATQALQAAPELRDLLGAEIERMVAAGEAIVPWTQLEETKPEVERLEEALQTIVDPLDTSMLHTQDETELIE